MPEKEPFISTLQRARERLRREGILSLLLRCLTRVGIRVSPFYYMKESLPPRPPGGTGSLPGGYEFSAFGLDDVRHISTLPERRHYVDPGYVLRNFNKGDLCFGIKFRGEIVAFTWVSLKECREIFHHAAMLGNEAYLHDMYVLKAFRGRNLAPVLRYKTYEILHGIGRDTYYSITEYFNASSSRFKQKLNATPVFLGVYIELFKTWRRYRRVIRRY